VAISTHVTTEGFLANGAVADVTIGNEGPGTTTEVAIVYARTGAGKIKVLEVRSTTWHLS
jgi:hypothetical protein